VVPIRVFDAVIGACQVPMIREHSADALVAKVGACMSPLDLRLYIAASATALTLLAFIVAGTSHSPSAPLLAVIGLVPPIIMPLWISRRDCSSGRC
jgi:hypothetical protein